MRLCLYTETALPKIGGQELVVDALAREFTAAGHEVVVLAQYPRRPLTPADDQLPYRVVRHRRFISTWRLVSYYRRYLTRLRASFPFDLLHCHSLHPCGYLGALTSRASGVPLVITSHGADLRPHRLSKPSVLERCRLAASAADALVSISRFTSEGLLQLCPAPKRIEQIPNGADIADLATPAPRPDLPQSIRAGKYVLFLGRLNPRKGVDVLLQAFVLLSRAAHDVRLVIAGDGEQRESLEMLAHSLGLTGRVSFVGMVAGRAKHWLLQNTCCVVVPSRTWEAFPLVVLEAYAAGKPVLGSRIAGLEDLILPGKTGLLVEPQQPAALAAALVEMLTNQPQTAAWSAAARRQAADYSWPAIAASHLKLYRQLTQAKRASNAA